MSLSRVKYGSPADFTKAVGISLGGILMIGCAVFILYMDYKLSLIDEVARAQGLSPMRAMLMGGLGIFGCQFVWRGFKGVYAALR